MCTSHYVSMTLKLNWRIEMVKIHGKEYVTVAERLDLIKKEHPDYGLTTEIIQLTETYCCIKATLTIGDRTFNGIAYEEKNASHINKTSFVECCETSAWGRAMAAGGYAGTEIASAEEVAHAIQNQPQQYTKTVDNPEEIENAKTEIHKLFANHDPESKKEILKRATYSDFKGRETWVDNINDLTINGKTPSLKQFRFFYKKIQETMLSDVANQMAGKN